MVNRYPLVSILIPTYNRPDYFQVALNSALQQVYPNIEIIIGDDSTNNSTYDLMHQKYLFQYKNITYIRNQTPLGQFQNDLMLFEYANGQYINYLMDDDVYHPQKIQKMIAFFDHNPKLALVTSYRKLINESGFQMIDAPFNMKLYAKNTIVSGEKIGNKMLLDCCNWIGEPTTPLFKKKDLTEPFGTLNKRIYNCCIDFASWIHLLSKGDLGYISEPLSYFRIHPLQQQQAIIKQLEGLEDMIYLILNSQNYGFLKGSELLKTALEQLFQQCIQYLMAYKNNVLVENRILYFINIIKKNLVLL